MYDADELPGAIFRARHERALSWIDELGLATCDRVVDVGCGAGFLTLAMAARGLRVAAIDTSREMLALTSNNARKEGLDASVALSLHDVHHLGCRDGAAILVTALGVIPWLRAPSLAVGEMARLVEPGGHLLVSSDNGFRLTHLVDPRHNPLLLPALRRVKRLMTSGGLASPDGGGVGERRYHPRRLERLLVEADLHKVRECSIGFGRFTFLGRRFLSDRAGLALDRRLQRLADRDVPVLRRLGNHTLVLARKAS